MGTSTDVTGPKGGSWAHARSRTTAFAKSGDRNDALGALRHYVAALGGAGAAAASAGYGTRTGGRLGAFAAGVANEGLEQTLRKLGLGGLVGKDRLEVLDGILQYILGDDDANVDERAAATQATLETLAEFFDPDATEFDQLEPASIDEALIEQMLVTFLANWLFNRHLNLFQERLLKHDDAADREQDMRDIVTSVIRLNLHDRSPLDVEWNGPEGTQILEGAIREAYDALEEGDR